MIVRHAPISIYCLCWLLSTALAATESVQEKACGPFLFAEASAELGLEFVHRTGARGDKHLAETMGAGLAWLDFDRDGWFDLYLVQSGQFPSDSTAITTDRLYRNLHGSRFDASDLPTESTSGYGQGVVTADVDGDGYSDLYVTNLGTDVLLSNQGDGTFADGSSTAGLGLDGWSSSAALADADSDGDLDLYVSRYVVYDPKEGIFCGDPETGERKYCDPSLFAGATDRFYSNLGDGRFVDRSAAAGIAPADGRGLGVVFADLNDDLLPDLYVANDLNANLLFANRGDGSFTDVSLISGAAVNREGRPEAGMGVALGDLDGDLDPDLAVTNFDVETNTLYLNQAEWVFVDSSGPAGFGMPSFNQLAFGIAAADFDFDGDLDFYIANGHIFEVPARQNVSYRQPDQLLEGDGEGGFHNISCEMLAGSPTVARGLASADYDNDGDIDLAVQENGGPLRILRNDLPPGSWLGLQLVGEAPNTDGIGAEITLSASKFKQRRWVLSGDSYQSSSDRRAVFGLGGAVAESVEVRWRSGQRLRILQPTVGRYLRLYERP